MMPYFSGRIVCFLVPVDLFFDCYNKHEFHTDTGHFEVYLNSGRIKVGKKMYFHLDTPLFDISLIIVCDTC